MSEPSTADPNASGRLARFRRVPNWLLGGVCGMLADAVAVYLIAPALLGVSPTTAGMVRAILHLAALSVAIAVQALAGVVLFPIVFALVARPLAERLAPGLPWWLVGIGFGVVLWLAAQALLLANTSATTDVTVWVVPTLIGHLLYGLTLAGVIKIRRA
jgi:hypothetical protein